MRAWIQGNDASFQGLRRVAGNLLPPSVASSFQLLSKSVQTAGRPAVTILGSMPVESGRVSQHQKIGKQPNCKNISFATPRPRIEPPPHCANFMFEIGFDVNVDV